MQPLCQVQLILSPVYTSNSDKWANVHLSVPATHSIHFDKKQVLVWKLKRFIIEKISPNCILSITLFHWAITKNSQSIGGVSVEVQDLCVPRLNLEETDNVKVYKWINNCSVMQRVKTKWCEREQLYYTAWTGKMSLRRWDLSWALNGKQQLVSANSGFAFWV